MYDYETLEGIIVCVLISIIKVSYLLQQIL